MRRKTSITTVMQYNTFLACFIFFLTPSFTVTLSLTTNNLFHYRSHRESNVEIQRRHHHTVFTLNAKKKKKKQKSGGGGGGGGGFGGGGVSSSSNSSGSSRGGFGEKRDNKKQKGFAISNTASQTATATATATVTGTSSTSVNTETSLSLQHDDLLAMLASQSANSVMGKVSS